MAKIESESEAAVFIDEEVGRRFEQILKWNLPSLYKEYIRKGGRRKPILKNKNYLKEKGGEGEWRRKSKKEEE